MDELPTNCLIKIFDYLENPKDIIAITCTCKKFLETISNFYLKFPAVRVDLQYLFYNKLKTFTYKDNEKDFNILLMQTTRQFQNIVLLNFNKEHTDRLGNKLLRLFENQKNIRTIRIKSDCMDLHMLFNVVQLTKKLVYLEIEGYRIAKQQSELFEDNNFAHLPSLKHLKINCFLDITPHLFNIFRECRSLKTIFMSGLEGKKMSSLNNLIFNQNALENLNLIGLDTNNTLFQCNQVVCYQLKKINIDYNCFSINLQKFVEFYFQQKSLQEVFLLYSNIIIIRS